MSGNKKPGKNSSRRGGMESIPKAISADGASGFNPIPSPFLRAGFDIGVDLSAPSRKHSQEGTSSDGNGDATGQTDTIATTNTTTTPPPHTPTTSASASTKKSSNAQAAKKGRVGVSKKQALAMKTLGMEDDDIAATPKKSKATKVPKVTNPPKASKASKTTQGSKAQKTATVTTPKKPKKGKTANPPKVTPSKRTHDESFADASYWSGKPKDEGQVFDSESDNATYKANDRFDSLRHSSDDEEDDCLKREREFALDNEVDDDDEYLTYYHGEDTPIRKHRT